MESNQKKILAIVVVAIVVIAAIAGVVIANNNTSSQQKYDSHSGDELLKMSWDDIKKEANGQTVTLGFYIEDPMVKPWFTDFQTKMKEKYNITVTTNSFGPMASKIVVEEMNNGKMDKGSIDLIWGNTSAYAAMTKSDYVYGGWMNVLPNSYYLKSNSESMIQSQVSWYKQGSAVEFSNGQTMLIYNADFNINYLGDGTKVPYDIVVLKVNGDDKFVKVQAGSTPAFTMGDVKDSISDAEKGTAYGIDSVRQVVKDAHGGTVKGFLKYSVPESLADLKEWVKIYPKQFGYPDATYASANFHTDLFIQAVMYGIDHETGQEVIGSARDTNVEWVNSKLADTTKDNFANADRFKYVIDYFNALDPYVHVYSSNAKYQNSDTIVAYNSKIVGAKDTDKDFSDETIMIAMSTVTSIDSRIGDGKQYDYNAGVFSLDTGCSSDYYLHIPANSSHKSAAMVIANELLDPEIQVSWYTTTGNGYNIDTTKTVKDGQDTVYNVYFKEKLKDLKRTLSPERLDEVTVVAKATSISAAINQSWASNVRDKATA